MANTVQLNKKYTLPHAVIWEFLITLTGTYPNQSGAIGTPGETVNFNGASNPNKLARPKIPAGPPAARLPQTSDIKVLNAPAGYDAVVEQNAANPTPANFAMRVFAAGSGNAAPQELGTGANYPATFANEPWVVHVYAPLKYN
jgi:hypothetical protein